MPAFSDPREGPGYWLVPDEEGPAAGERLRPLGRGRGRPVQADPRAPLPMEGRRGRPHGPPRDSHLLDGVHFPGTGDGQVPEFLPVPGAGVFPGGPLGPERGDGVPADRAGGNRPPQRLVGSVGRGLQRLRQGGERSEAGRVEPFDLGCGGAAGTHAHLHFGRRRLLRLLLSCPRTHGTREGGPGRRRGSARFPGQRHALRRV